jgi:hypothetical protein
MRRLGSVVLARYQVKDEAGKASEKGEREERVGRD